MNCPEHLVFQWRGVYLWLYWRDVPRRMIPLKVWLNPLRYQLTVPGLSGKNIHINQYGRAAMAYANWRYRLFGR